MKNLPQFRILLALLIPVLIGSSCVTTRAQIRREAETGGKTAETTSGMQTQVTEVPVDSATVDELRSELARVAGRLEELERTNQELTRRNSGKTEETKTLETRIQELEASQMQMIEALKKREKEAPKTEPVELFQKAKQQHEEKDHVGATESLNEYLKFPKGKFTEEALFLRAESLYAQKLYRKAILDYSSVQEKFPKSKKMPQILLRIGQAFEAIGEKADAKIFFQELIDKHPRSPEARKVASKLR